MDTAADRDYLQPYHQAVQRFGPGFQATLWGSRDAQARRFDVLIELGDFVDRIVVDAGCGHGDFAQHMVDRGIAFGSFVGVDAMPEMITEARRRQLPRSSFVTGDFVQDLSLISNAEPDWVTVSGSFNTMDDSAARRLVRSWLEIANQGVVFNFLSDRHHTRWNEQNLGPARRFDTAGMLDWAMNQTPRVAFRQDYLDGHDATIALYR